MFVNTTWWMQKVTFLRSSSSMRWSGTRPKGCWRKCGRRIDKGAKVNARPARQDCGSSPARINWKNHTRERGPRRTQGGAASPSVLAVSLRQQITIQTDQALHHGFRAEPG